ncbi:hypothetical protein NDU88_000340 [Pleurodeles waltl]|uniref:Uncharacterized protein n=1 Tax=Pleurodeles waltl TaxID=8319 RepID=A0AAV7U3Q4_PLEWA|nr:hypothetical protein NDU88_000340 [Pleurodeles waltl]
MEQCYSSNLQIPEEEGISEFINDCPMHNLTPEQRMALESELMVEGVTLAIAQMQTGIAPGPTNIPIELFRKLPRHVVASFHATYKAALENGVLSEDQQAVTIAFLPKEGISYNKYEPYRPLSLINADTTILANALATRLGAVILDLIHPDQNGFMSGGTTKLNVR